jgi:hypothetical protein
MSQYTLCKMNDEEPLDEKLILRRVQEMTDAKINASVKHFGDNLMDGVREYEEEYEDDNAVLNKIANDRLETFSEFNNIGIFTNEDCLSSSTFIRDDSLRRRRRDDSVDNCNFVSPPESPLDLKKKVNRDGRRELVDRLTELILNENAAFSVKFEGSYAGVSLKFDVSINATNNLREE